MIIRNPPKITNQRSILKYIEVDLWNWLKELTTNLFNIDFKQNFMSFTVQDLEIPANTEVSINNQFKNVYPGLIPSARIITRQQGNATIIDGDTVWNENHVFLKNPSANDAVITVIFFR